MNHSKESPLQYENFIYALTIEERIAAFKNNGYLVNDDTIILDDKWFSIKSIVSPDVFFEELDNIGIRQEELACVLKTFQSEEKKILIEYLGEQRWFDLYKEIMLEYECKYKDEPIICEQLVLPYKLYVEKQLYRIESNLHSIRIKNELIQILCSQIIGQLSKLTWKCIVVEITDFKKENILNGINGQERYFSFLSSCYKYPCQIQSFYNKYPVLGRIVTQKMLDLVKAIEEMLTNLDHNYFKLNNLFGINTKIIQDIKMSMGDTHQRGKTVAEIVFDNNFKYIYKPRNSYSAQAFYKMAEYINSNANLKDIFINKTFYAEDFTVEQFIEAQPCENRIQVKNYYYRFGMLTVFVSLLNGSDIHYENIIAQGEYPCIIDLETLFTQNDFFGKKPDANIEVINNQILNLSATCLLPQKISMYNMGDDFDVSALAGGVYQQVQKKCLVPKNVYTDEMCFVYENYDNQNKNQNKNRPMLNGIPQKYQSYKQDIYNGFNDMLDWVFKNTNELKDFIEKAFHNLMVRQVMKATAVYSNMVSYLDHPSYLKDMIKFEKLLENNWGYPYTDKRLVKYEIMDLRHIEIPIFYTNTSKTYLKTSNGVCIDNYFNNDALSNVLNKISSLKMESVKKEKVKLQLILGDYQELINNKKIVFKKDRDSNTGTHKNTDILRICTSIAEDIIKDAVIDEDSISWEYFEDCDEIGKITFINNGLYSGRAGILLYLYYLNNKIKSKSISAFTRNLLKSTKCYIEPIGTSIFNGGCGSLYALLKCNMESNNYKLVQNAMIGIGNITEEANNSWLDGRAGLLKLLYHIFHTDYKCNLTEKTIRKVMNSFCHDLKIQEEEKCSPGFTDGVVGQLYGLLLGQSLLKEDYGVEIEKLLKLCEKTFHKLVKPSKDNISQKHNIMEAGVGALACKRCIQDDRLNSYVNLAIETIKKDLNGDMSICNGLAGELDFLMLLLQDRKNDAWAHRTICQMRNNIIDFYNDNGFILIDDLSQFKKYGLLEGMSGTGYTLLRSLYPIEIPSVLLYD